MKQKSNGSLNSTQFLEARTSREQAGGRGTIRDSGEAAPQHVPKAPSAGPQELLPKPVGVLLSFLFSVPRIRPMKL